MKDFSLNDLSSTELDKVHESPTLIFPHLNRNLTCLPTQSVEPSHSSKQPHETSTTSFFES